MPLILYVMCLVALVITPHSVNILCPKYRACGSSDSLSQLALNCLESCVGSKSTTSPRYGNKRTVFVPYLQLNDSIFGTCFPLDHARTMPPINYCLFKAVSTHSHKIGKTRSFRDQGCIPNITQLYNKAFFVCQCHVIGICYSPLPYRVFYVDLVLSCSLNSFPWYILIVLL